MVLKVPYYVCMWLNFSVTGLETLKFSWKKNEWDFQHNKNIVLKYYFLEYGKIDWNNNKWVHLYTSP